MDVKKTHREKARWELLKNAARCLEQILEVALYQTVTVRPLTSHHTNHSSKASKMCRVLLGKQRRIQTRHSLMDIYMWTCQYWPTRKHLHQLYLDTGCNLEDLPGAMDERDGCQKRERERESGGELERVRSMDEPTFSYGHDGHLHMDVSVLSDQQRLTSAVFWHKMKPRRPPRSEGWKGRMTRERERESERVRGKDKLKSNVHLWASAHRCVSVGWPESLISGLCWHKMKTRRPSRSDELKGQMTRESENSILQAQLDGDI